MLPQAHVTKASRMSGSRWVITPSCLSGSLRYFLYSSSLYSCHLFLISSASLWSMPFMYFIVPIFAWNIISSLSHSTLFLYFFSLIYEEAFFSLLALLWNSAFRWLHLSFSPLSFISIICPVICKASSNNHLAFLWFLLLGTVLITASCAMWPTSILQTLYQT